MPNTYIDCRECSKNSLKIRLFLKTLAMCMRVFFTFKSMVRLSTCKCVPVGCSLVDTSPLTSAITPSRTASKSPDPLAGMISKTPELVYFARIINRGIVMRASNGELPSLNLPMIRKRPYFMQLHMFGLADISSYLILFTVKLLAPKISMFFKLTRYPCGPPVSCSESESIKNGSTDGI